MDKIRTTLYASLAAAAIFAGQAYATPVDARGQPPPGWILNLDGQPVPMNPPHYEKFTVNFTATQTSTNITFALIDSSFDAIFLDDIAVANLDNPSDNLLVNGGFEGGIAASGGNASAPVGWKYLNPHGVPFESGVACGSYGRDGSSCAWSPGFADAYDLITQPLATTVWDTYQISFWALGPDEGHYWQAQNGDIDWPVSEGNAFNITVYAGNIPVRPVPEPASLGMFSFGVLLVGGVLTLRRRERRQA